MYSKQLTSKLLAFVITAVMMVAVADRLGRSVTGGTSDSPALLNVAGTPTIGSFTDGLATVTPGGYVSLYAKNVAESGSGTIAGVRFYRESNFNGGLQPGGDAYVGMGVYANGIWTYKAPTSGLSGTQTYYAVAYDTAGTASAAASVTASLIGSGFSNWSTLQPFLGKVPLSVGYIPSTSVVNFGTTVYTGPLDTSITLDRLRDDNGPNRSGDGALFTNNGNPPLPTNRGNFYEFTINPQTGCSPNFTTSQIAFPGPLRFMVDTSGDVYFTGDHYATDRNLYIGGTPSVGSVTISPASAAAGTAVTLNASSVSETISPLPNLNANTGSNILAAVSNVQFFVDINGTAGLQSDTDRLLGSGVQDGSTWSLGNASTTGLASGTYMVYAVGVDPAGNTSTQTSTLTITAAAIGKAPADFDGDGKTDESVFRPSDNVWYLNRSQAGFVGYQFGAAGDVLAPADFTGDGKTDVAVFRPSAGAWFILKSEDNTFYSANFGTNGDVPVPGDFDGDGKADTAVFRPSTGYWFIQQSTAGFSAVPFGTNGDVPTVGDFDGDGKADVAVFRSSNGVWYRLNSSNGSFFGAQFGQAGDKVVPADYSGDGKTDLAVWRPSNGTWYIQRSEDNSFYGAQFGATGDLPTPGDYDGDGKADTAVFRPSSGTWFEQRSTSGFTAFQFGANGDKPAPNAYAY